MNIMSYIFWVALTLLVLWISCNLFLSENIFKDAGIPYSSKLTSLFGLIYIFIYPLHELILRNYMKNKKLLGQYVFGRPQLNVGDPDLIKQILVKDFQYFVDRLDIATGDPNFDNTISILKGEDWKRVRTVLSPGFSTGKIRKMTNTILDCTETLKNNLEANALTGKLVDVKRFFGTFTMDAIVSTAFGSKIDSHNDPDNPFVVAARNVFGKSSQLRMFLFFVFNSVTKFLGLKASDIFGSKFFVKASMKLIEERVASGETRSDFLQLLLEARKVNREQVTDETKLERDIDIDTLDDDAQLSNDNGHSKSTDVFDGKKGLTELEFMATCVTFFVGGYETVASTLAFAVYELALNEEHQKTLITEIDELIKREKKLTYDNIQSLKYLDAVVSETLRKYPPAANTARMATSDYTFRDMNFKIPKGTVINIPIYGLHHDPEYYPDPDKFLPSRFSPEEKSSRNPYVYLPFGAGPRNCIAMRFALIEVKLCLANVLRSFTFHKSEKTQVPLKFPPVQIQLIAPEIFLRIKKRILAA